MKRAIALTLFSVIAAAGIAQEAATSKPAQSSVSASPALPAGASPHLTILPIRAFQQTTSYTCGPAALITLLRYYDREGKELTIADEASCTPGKGTSPQGMVGWLESHGFDVTWGEQGSLEMIRKNLERRVPTLVEWIDYGGHWVLAVGYDDKGTESDRDDVIWFADPADGHDGTRDGLTSFNARRFNAMWFDAFLFERPMFKVYITAVPREETKSN